MNDNSKYLVEKSNILNGITTDKKTGSMNLIEYRFFCMYLSRINPLDESTIQVKISIKDFEKVFGVKIHITHFTNAMMNIMHRTVIIKEENKKTYINLYSKFVIDENEPEYITISANQDIIPYIFELQKNYTKYMLENIINLNSVSKIRLYEILVQNQHIGDITIDLEELKSMIISNISEFKQFNDKILKPAIEDINKYTDLNVTYEKVTKKRKVVAIKFIIEGKKKKSKEIAVSETKEKELPKVSKKDSASNINDCFTELYNRYFKDRNFKKSDTETIIIKLTEKVNSFDAKVKQIEEIEIYLKNLIAAYDKQRGNKTLENKVGYILGMIEKSAFIKPKPEYRQREEQSYDINEFEKYAINYEELKKVEEQSEDVQHNFDAEEIAVSESNFKAETVQQFFERVGYKE